jgi:hypothetical protein
MPLPLLPLPPPSQVRPVTDELKLNNLASQPDEALRPEFLAQVRVGLLGCLVAVLLARGLSSCWTKARPSAGPSTTQYW